MGEIRCNQCRQWFPSDESECPICGMPRPGWNRRLHTAALDGNLNGQLEGIDRSERRYQELLHKEREGDRKFGWA